jgi:two-component system cit operon sensor histidine kinase CitA
MTTKRNGDHGIGLYLISSYVTQVAAPLKFLITRRAERFSLFIPETGHTTPRSDSGRSELCDMNR